MGVLGSLMVAAGMLLVNARQGPAAPPPDHTRHQLAAAAASGFGSRVFQRVGSLMRGEGWSQGRSPRAVDGSGVQGVDVEFSRLATNADEEDEVGWVGQGDSQQQQQQQQQELVEKQHYKGQQQQRWQPETQQQERFGEEQDQQQGHKRVLDPGQHHQQQQQQNGQQGYQ